MRNNIVTAHAGEKTYIKTDPVFQYDYGLILMIDGVTLPEEYDVQFGNSNSASAKTVTGGANGVQVPDEYLLNGEDIHAYLYMHTSEDDGFSVYHIHIPVIDRAAIAEEEITPIEHNVIKEALEKLAEAVEETEANVSHYPYISGNKNWMVYDAVQGEYVDTGVKAQGEDAINLSVGEVTTLLPGQPATASITWSGGNGLLNLGLPLGDVSSLVSIHDEQYNKSTVTVKDGADNLLVDDLTIAFAPIQAGTGTPGPRNIRRISGVTGVTFTHVAGSDTHEYLTSFESSAGTVYSGTFYPMIGKLIIDRILITKRCVDMDNLEVQPGWQNSGIRDVVGENVSQTYLNQTLNIGTSYSIDTTDGKDLLYLDYDQYHMRQTEWVNTEITVQICVQLPAPIEYTFEPYTPAIVLGDNTYSVDAGKIAYIKYPCDMKKYIDTRIAELQALVLEH